MIGEAPGSGGVGPCDLTVVIVNYNVRYFLEQCLYSVTVAARGLRVQTVVVDNDSRDTSLDMLRARADVTLIENRVNVGFAKANNQGIRIARGRYVLLLNPDTLVPEDAFRTCLAYADAHADVGALGVRMVDGGGVYLPESKRGLPTPWVSFAKMAGLGRLAPTSRHYNGYYLGHLPADEVNDVDVLPGAFMWLRPEAIAAAGGGLDEDYFMYGEDIDLSFVVQRAGFRVVYFPEVTIVHYKGESTRKRSWRYVKAFYRAMAIFSRKHLRGGGPAVSQPLLDAAIYARAALAVATNAVSALLPVLADALVFVVLLLGLRDWWALYYFGDPDYYAGTDFEWVNVPLYTGLWCLGLYASGAYDRPFRLWASLRGVGVGTVLALLAYALLPAEYHTSRALIVLTGGLGALALGAWRLAWSVVRPADVSLTRDRVGRDRRLAVVGTVADEASVLRLLGRAGVGRQYFGRIGPAEDARAVGDREAEPPLGPVSQLGTLSRAYGIDELVFGLGSVGVDELQRAMLALGPRVDYRTLCPGGAAIVGSPSREAPGESYALVRPFALGQPSGRRAKRSLDAVIALAMLLFPALALVADRPLAALVNALAVLFGGLTWVGYAGTGGTSAASPTLRPGVLPQGLRQEGSSALRDDRPRRSDEHYARYWRVLDDARAIWDRRRELGRAPVAIDDLAPARWPSRRVASRPPA